MPVKAVYASGVLAVYVRGEQLDALLDGAEVFAPLTLKGEVIGKGHVMVELSLAAQENLRGLVNLERAVMEEQRTAVMRANPNYSNRKIRKGKGHGKG